MGLTLNEQVFMGVRESAIDEALEALCTQRPRILRYASSLYLTDPFLQTQADPLPGGIEWMMDLSLPRIDINPATSWPVAVPDFVLEISTANVDTSIGISFASGMLLVGHPVLTAANELAMALDKVELTISIVPAFIKQMIEAWMLANFAPMIGQVKLAVPSLGISPIIPAGPPLSQNNEFQLRGNF